jgi:hypothetical protein
VPISELVFATLTQNWSSLEPSLGFAAIAGPPHIVDVHDTYKPLKSRSGAEAGPQQVVAHQAGRQRCVGPASRPQLDPKTLGRIRPDVNVV